MLQRCSVCVIMVKESVDFVGFCQRQTSLGLGGDQRYFLPRDLKFSLVIINRSMRRKNFGVRTKVCLPCATTRFFFIPPAPPPHNPNRSENQRSSTRSIISSLLGGIKGSPIHPLEGSCLGYHMIPYYRGCRAALVLCQSPLPKMQHFN